MFDLIVGTSTGGILAAGLTVPDGAKQAMYSASELLDLYVNQGRTIFRRSFWRGVTSVQGALDEQYDHAPLEKVLEQYFGDAKLENCVKPLVLTSYDIERRQPYFFKSETARTEPDRKHLLREAVRATSAAPTFFEPVVVNSLSKPSVRRVLIDGGVFVNNPAMCAFVEALKLGATIETMRVVSIGTGVATRKIPYHDAKGWGALGWVRPVISVMMDGQADAADYHLQLLFATDPAVPSGEQRYFRFDTELDLALDDLDAANAGNIAALRAEAQQIIKTQSREMNRLTAVLAA
jgi:patatin-like phospholipase/acyl hydrolase